MSNRWKEYFEGFLTVRDYREVDETYLGMGAVRNERENISKKEVRSVHRRMQCGKATGLDGIATELLNKGGEAIAEWL